jgi:hypothetical protein
MVQFLGRLERYTVLGGIKSPRVQQPTSFPRLCRRVSQLQLGVRVIGKKEWGSDRLAERG